MLESELNLKVFIRNELLKLNLNYRNYKATYKRY